MVTGPGAAAARTDLTRTRFRGYVRRDERWPEDSEQYKAGCAIEHRKMPPMEEIPGDAFDRQRVICGFDQGLVERQVCLILGAGGIGQDVALTLARLGVGRIILVDNDVYESSNLTRQCLGCLDDIGQRKVDVAARTLREKHCIVSEVEAVHCDAVLEWPRIVELARRSTVVFNGIDVGIMFDYCVNSLCKELSIPLVSGQSFGWKYMTEMYTGREDEVCAFCFDSPLTAFGASAPLVSRRPGGSGERLRWFIEQRNPGGEASSSSSAPADSELLCAFLIEDRQFRSSGSELLPEIVRAALERAGLAEVGGASAEGPAKGGAEAEAEAELHRERFDAELLAFLKALGAEASERLLPGSVCDLPDIAFIPRPAHADTRYVGSWVCPCLGCAVAMVSQWAAWLTAPLEEVEEADAPPAAASGDAAGAEPEAVAAAGASAGPVAERDAAGAFDAELGGATEAQAETAEEAPAPVPVMPWKRRNVPQTITFNLDFGLTSEEQLGYELGALGIAPDRAERRFICEPSSSSCVVCAAAASLCAEEALFFGRLPVVLAPAPGDVRPCPSDWRSLPTLADAAEAARARALGRRSPLGDELGEDYASVVVPALPALDWERGGQGSDEPWPAELSCSPLLKVPLLDPEAAQPSALSGVASGIRSALVKAKGRWWRLKGCGNRDEGFPLKAMGDLGEQSVRGCLFEHTADTELRMTDLAAAVLGAAGLDCANIPLGSYRYACSSDWPAPKIERHCAVFETLGNARLGDHLLAGLGRLLPHLLPLPADGFASLRRALAAGRSVGDGEELWPTSMVASCGMAAADVGSELARLGLHLEEAAPPSASDLAVPAELAVIFDRARRRLGERLPLALGGGGKQGSDSSGGSPKQEPSLLLWLAWRLGWECGATVQALHAGDISWGTYPDAMGIHCNAHANNLVVKPRARSRTAMLHTRLERRNLSRAASAPGASGCGASAATFLAALDFDMAFTRAAYLPEAAAGHSGIGLDTWEGLLSFEATMGMKTTLSGSDFANTGVANNAEAAAVPPTHAVAEIAFRDTLVAAYDAARTGNAADAHPPNQELYEAACDLIELALCLTTHVEG